MLHDLCNYRCAYCDESYWGGSHRWLKFDDVRRFLDQLVAINRRDLYHISFTGGEPTLWPEFPRLCRYLKERRWEIGMTSNGSKPLSFWDEVKDDFNWISLSYHPQYAKDDHFLELIRLLSARAKVAVRLMMHRERRFWERSFAFGETLRSLKGINSTYVEYVPLQENFGKDSTPVVYEPWQQEAFRGLRPFAAQDPEIPATPRKFAAPDLWNYQVVYADGARELCRPNELVVQDLVDFEGWTCFAGVEMMFVDHTGEIYRGGCKIGGRIGRIGDESFSFPSAPVVCTKNFCPCGTDIQTKKFSPESPRGR
jgi:hypothetical protein